MKRRFDIEGMHCSGCAFRVQSRLKKISGIKDAVVNPASETLFVDYDPQIVDVEDIKNTVENLGYKLVSNIEAPKKSIYKYLNKRKDIKSRHTGNVLIISLIFLIPLLLIGLSPILHYELPTLINYQTHSADFCIIQLILCLPILFIGRNILKNGWIRLFRFSPNIDSLIMLGAAAAFIYSIIISYIIIFNHYDKPFSIYYLAAGIIITLRMVGVYIEKNMVGQNIGDIQSLLTLIPDNAVCVRTEINEENEETTKFDKVHTQNIKTDDIILIKKNERIAADGIVIKGKCHLNEQVFTGKSEVRNISKGDKVLAGTLVEDGEIYVQVSAFGEDSFLYNIISLIEEGENSKPNLSRLADKVSSIAIQIILAFGLLCGIIWYFIDYDFLFSLNVFISILIIGAPGSLGLAIPLSVLVASRKGKSQGILIRRISSFEIIKNSTAFVFNQTGTITKGTPEITDIIILGDMKKEELLFYAASTEMNSLHPLARSIVTEAIKNNITLVTPDPFKIISGEGIEAVINETRVDIGNYKLMELININEAEIEKTLQLYKSLSQEGKSVVIVAIEGVIQGLIAAKDEARPNVRDVMTQLHKLNKETVLLTGDHWSTAKNLANDVDIKRVFAETKSNSRARIIRKLQFEGETVVMVGDGINDATAIAQADAGIAIGMPNDIAADAADIVLLNNDLRQLLTTIRLANKTIRNMKENLFLVFFYNLLMLPLASGILYLLGINFLIDPMLSSIAMFLGFISVIINALRLNKFK